MYQRFFLFCLLTLIGPALHAATVTYSTSSSQLCIGAAGCGVNSQTVGGGSGVTITYNPVATATVNAIPSTSGSLGSIVVSCVGGGTACGSQSLAGMNLYINIAQTAPTAGNGSISGGVMTGLISGTASSAVITWAAPAGTVGNITYAVTSTPLGLVPASVQGGVSAVTGSITDNAYVDITPVPTLSQAGLIVLVLLLVAVAFVLRRRIM